MLYYDYLTNRLQFNDENYRFWDYFICWENEREKMKESYLMCKHMQRYSLIYLMTHM